MAIILISAIIGLVYYKCSANRHITDILVSVVIGIFASLLARIFVPYECISKQEATQQYIIYSMNDNNTIGGRFILGTGSIDGKSVYSAYVQDDNSIRRIDVPTECSVIKFIDSGFVQTITMVENRVDWSKIAPYIVFPITNNRVLYEIQVDKSRANFTNQIEFDLK